MKMRKMLSSYGSFLLDNSHGDEPVNHSSHLCVFTRELKRLALLSWPATLGYFFTFSMTSISLAFCGRLGQKELDAAGLAMSILNVTGLYICMGMTSACDTLFSQAYGGQNFKLLAIYFQRSLIIMSLTCIPCWAIHLNVESILTLMNQDPCVAKLTAEYMVFFMPAVMFNFWFQVCVKFLQSQDVVIPVVVVGFLGNAFNILTQYVLVNVQDKGIRGSAVAQASSWCLMCTLIIVYIKKTALKDNWEGWSLMCLENWWAFMKLALGGLTMTLAEWCTVEGAIIATGTFGVVQQASLAISMQIAWISLLCVYGIGIGCSIRVGQYLGAGNSEAAKTVYRVAQITGFGVTGVIISLLLLLRNVIPSVFTSHREVRDHISGVIYIICIQHAWDATSTVATGALRGCGLQWITGIVSPVLFVVIGIPLSAVLMFATSLQSLGFWWGLSTTFSAICCILMTIMCRLNWDKHAKEAGERIKELQHLSDKHDSCSEMNSSQLLEQQEKSSKIKLLFRRFLVLVLVLGIFCAGLLTRLLVSLPNGNVNFRCNETVLGDT